MDVTKETKFWHKGSLGEEDDAWTSNTCIAQRKHAITHSTMKNNCDIIECCNDTHQANKRALALQTSVTLVALLIA